MKSTLLKAAAILLIILGLIMLALGIRGNIIPPALTGVGFIFIGIVFWNQA